MKLQPTFPGMVPGERVVMMLHRHWFFALQIFLAYAFFGLVPLVGWWALHRYTTVFQNPQTFIYLLVVLSLAAYILVWALLLMIAWVNFYLDVWIVTTERIINIEQVRLFDRIVSEQKLFRVQDVTTQVTGIIAGMLHFGEVSVQTAGQQERFVFEQVPHPEKVAQTIMHLLDSIEHQIGLDKFAKVEDNLGQASQQKTDGAVTPVALNINSPESKKPL
jgi:hypothetical protein